MVGAPQCPRLRGYLQEMPATVVVVIIAVPTAMAEQIAIQIIVVIVFVPVKASEIVVVVVVPRSAAAVAKQIAIVPVEQFSADARPRVCRNMRRITPPIKLSHKSSGIDALNHCVMISRNVPTSGF